MRANTKDKILTVSINLFNRFGYVNVRLQHIADEAELSIGNLAYHFKTKDEILEKIYQKIELEQKSLLSELRIVPLFVNIDKYIRTTYQIQAKYSFFYSDTFEILRTFPVIKKKYRQYTSWVIAQIEFMLKFNASRGVFDEVKIEKNTKNLSINYWMTVELWLYQNRVRGTENINEEAFVLSVWTVLFPYFTQIGTKEYEQITIFENFNWL